MSNSPTFIDRMGADLRQAYLRYSMRRRRRKVAAMVAVVALGATGAAGAVVTGIFNSFTILPDQHANIVGVPPEFITCGPSGCVPGRQPASGGWLYQLNHRVGDGMPTWGNLREGLMAQGAFDGKGNTLNPPEGAVITYACTTMDANNLDCVPEDRVGELPWGTAIYVLSLTEYPGYSGPSEP
jgi:hypothetical protein